MAKEAGFALPSRRAAAYFACLGAGFMVAEVALVQRLHVVLGHPTYALVVVLAGLLVATGIGSLLSERFVRTERAVVRVAQLAGLLLLIVPWGVIGPLARATAVSPMSVRVVWSLAVAGVVGVVLGTLFPAALRYLDRTTATPLALAINGAAAVVGSVLCVVVSVSLGIPYAFFFAAVLYGLAAACGPTSWPAATRTPS
jgi:predicted membrane-bound spermidine synthase